MITVVNKRTYKGQGVWICRGKSFLGNPFSMRNTGLSRTEVIAKYKVWFENGLSYNGEVLRELDRLIDLAKKGDLILVCWCAPKACHGDVIKKYIEKELLK